MKSHRLIFPTLAAFVLALALSGCGTSTSPTSSVPSLDSSPPAAPTQLSSTLDATSGSQYLEWAPSASPSVTRYEVFVYSPSPARDNAYVMAGTTDANTPRFHLPLVPEVTQQYYRVRAVAGASNIQGALSPVVAITIQPPSNPGGGDPDQDPGRPKQ